MYRLKGKTILIADLHLASGYPTITHLFSNFCATLPQDLKHLIILGDFFEYWLGDDAADAFQLSIAQQLKDLHYKGIHIYFMAGNRDFLLSEQFLRHFGGIYLKDPTKIEINGLEVLLTHGDRLCTHEPGYQLFRMCVQNRLIKSFFLNLPVKWRQKIALKLRQHSKGQQRKRKVYGEIPNSAIILCLKKHHVNYLIHGHIHQAGIHYPRDNAKRIVLGDWFKTGSMLLISETGGIRLQEVLT